VLGMAIQVDAVAVERVGEQNFRRQPRRADSLLVQQLGTLLKGSSNRHEKNL